MNSHNFSDEGAVIFLNGDDDFGEATFISDGVNWDLGQGNAEHDIRILRYPLGVNKDLDQNARYVCKTDTLDCEIQ